MPKRVKPTRGKTANEKKSPAPVRSPDDSHLWTPQEAATFLGTTVGALAVHRAQATLDLPYIKFGHNVRYERADVIDFVESHKIRPVKPTSIELGLLSEQKK